MPGCGKREEPGTPPGNERGAEREPTGVSSPGIRDGIEKRERPDNPPKLVGKEVMQEKIDDLRERGGEE